jgi:hypothetical protein
MGMLRLAAEIQQHILAVSETVRQPAISERALRPIAQLDDYASQRVLFSQLVKHIVGSHPADQSRLRAQH